MKKLAFILGASALAAFATAADTVINFDDLVGQGGMAPGYGGVANWGTYSYYDWSQPPYTPSSGNTRVYAQPGSNGAFYFGSDVKFKGAYFSGYGLNDLNGSAVYFELYDLGTLVHTSAATDISGTPTWLSAGYWGPVDEVHVLNTQNTNGYWVMDDVTYCGGAVPEPCSMIALGGGLVAVLRRRKK